MRWGGGGPPALDAEDTPFLGPGGLAGCGRASSFESEIRWQRADYGLLRMMELVKRKVEGL